MNTFSTVGPVRRSNGRIALGAALLVLAASVTLVDASVIDQGSRWGGDPLVPTGEATIIKICWVEGSSSSEDSYSGSFHSTPSLNTVLAHIQDAVNHSWAIPSSVSFQGWGPCSEILFSDRPQYVGLYIHSEVSSRVVGFGPNNLLGTTSVSCSGKDSIAAQFLDCDRNETECIDAFPFGCGGTWNPAGINLQPWGTIRADPSHCVELFDGYSFDCVEQYAIHEFGHALGILHEMAHPDRNSLAPSCGASDSVVPVNNSFDYYDPLNASVCAGIGGACQADADCGIYNCLENYVVVNPKVYDFDSVMAYGPGCADTTGERFGSPRADALDVQGVVEVYGPPVSPNFYSDPISWRSLLVNAGFAVRQFLTTATNVALANEVTAPPTANLSVGSPLTFLATTAGLPFSFTLDALQPGAWMVYRDQSLPGWDGTLSIGDVNPSGCDDCYADDDFELSFDPTANIYGVGFYLVDNNFESGEKIYVYGASGLLAECGGGPDACVILPADSGAAGSFVGVIADEPITSIRFDENAGGDDIAIRDLIFAYGPQTGIAYPDLPVTPLAINASTTCSGAGDNPLQRTIHVPDDFVIGDVKLAFNATHTYREDVRVILRSPLGTEVNVIGQGEMATGYDVLLDDSALGPLSNGLDDDTAAPYFAREATPSSPLSTFVGERAGGDWIVRMCDFHPLSENGAYNRSQLILQPKQPTATEPVVTSALDTVDPTDGVTTLREAMAVANATNGTITFDPSLAGQVITISTAALGASGAPLDSAFLVDSAVLIDGTAAPGLSIVISGPSPLRHFLVNASGHLTLRNLTLSGGTGSSGGAIEVRGDAAGATAKAVRGYLSVENSTFELNSATSLGGAIRVVIGTAVLTNTTVVQNTSAVFGGGALFCGAESDCRVLSSTFASNSGGGIYFNNVNSLLLLENSFVADNNGADLTGSPVSGESHHNLVGDPASAGGLIEGANNNLVGDGNGGLLPGFLYYGDNGGPTWTVLPSARGIDAGQTFLPVDQRGAPREAPADIGAVEIPRYEVSTTVDDGAGSLREAVASALAFHGGTIDIVTSGPIVLTTPSAGESAFVIDAALTIEGNGATILRDPNAPDFRLFDVISPGSLTLRDLTLVGGVASDGGLIRSAGALTIERSTIADGSGSSFGGGIYSGGLSLVDSTIRGNFAGGGGGIYNVGQAHVTNSTIVDNFGGSGGGIANRSGATLFLDNSTLSGNQSANGGALFSDAATVTIDSSTIVGNTATNLGGGILKINNGTMLLRNSVVAGNTRFTFDEDIEYVLGSGVSAASHHNLISTPASAGGLIHGVNSNILGDGAGGVLPLATILNPSLVYNGGSTWTHDLVPTSPAIDAGLTVLSTDQRGVSRPQGSTYDIGAVEYLLIPTQIIVAVQTLPGGGPTLFSFAGDAAGTIADGQSIFATVTPGTYGVTEDSGAIVDKIAFVTSGSYSGDLVTEANGLGLGPFNPALPGEGLLAADAICNYHAQNAAIPLSGTYTAWLSDSSTDARDRLAAVGPWVRTDGAPVAADVADLITCSPDCLANPIDKDENGAIRPSEGGTLDWAWARTGTQAGGTRASTTCVGWTSSVSGGPTGNGLVGVHAMVSAAWTTVGNNDCEIPLPIYCFGDVGGSVPGPPAGWELVSIACDDADSTGDLPTASATFQVGLAESVTCTFTNALPGLCTVNTDGDASFDCADTDDDNDGVPDASDPEPLSPTVCGLDVDADGCDDCSVGVDGLGPLADADPADDGTDTDADGICDATDCAPGDPGNNGTLGPVFGLVFTSQDDFQWSAPLLDGGGSLVYDVLRSTTAADFSGAACAETDITVQAAFDPTPPPPGGESYYLIRVQAACGGEHLGFGSDAPQRRSAASCP